MKPEMRSEYLELCSPSLPYIDLFFDDEVEKKVKDIQDVNRGGSKFRNALQSSEAGDATHGVPEEEHLMHQLAVEDHVSKGQCL